MKVFGALLLVACLAACNTAARVAVIEDEVAAVGSIALLNPRLTSQQRARLTEDLVLLHQHLEEIK